MSYTNFLSDWEKTAILQHMQSTATIVTSSAGSGKTFTLVKEYLVLALTGRQSFNHILAITFTNKAANEMKTRIISYTRELAAGEDTDMGRQLMIATGLSSQQLSERAQVLLRKILHEYYDFSVMTIDSFIIRIVRAFSLDMGLPHQYDIDMSRSTLLRAASDRVLDRFATAGNEALSALLVEFAAHKIHAGKSWDITKDVYSAARELFSENAEPYLEQLATFTPEQLREILSFHRANAEKNAHMIRKCARIVVDHIDSLGLSQDDFANKSRGIVGILHSIAQEHTLSEKLLEKIIRLRTLDLTDYCRKGSVEHARCLAAAPRIARRIDVFMGYAETAYKAYQSSRAVLAFGYTLGVLRSIEIGIQEYSREHKLIPISEFNKKVHDLVRNEAVPFIYWRAGDTFTSYLIDEFQDTSGRQWDNIWPLLDETLAASDDNRTVLCVGDTKQAIYRWRGGNADIMRHGIEMQIKASGKSVSKKSLTANYRSYEEIVLFNNHYFSFLRSYLKDHAFIGDELDVECSEQVPHKGPGGSITVDIYEKNTEDTAQKIIAYIAALSGCAYKDHAILVRSKNEGTRIARALFDAGIPVVSPDSLRIDNNPAVQFILAMLRVMADHSDDIARITALRCHAELFNAGNDAMTMLMRADPVTLQEYCNAYIPREFHRLFCDEEQSRNDLWGNTTPTSLSLSVYDTVEHLLASFQLSHTHDGNSAGYLQVFTDCVLSFAARHNGSVTDFLEWWDTLAEESPPSLSLPESLDAVRIMTVHASKGLEFPSVIIPLNSGWIFTLKKGQHPSSVWATTDQFPVNDTVDPNAIPYYLEYNNDSDNSYFADDFRREARRTAIDMYNILYVAFTRARTRLHVLCETETLKDGTLQPTAAGITAQAFNDCIVSVKNTAIPNNKPHTTIPINTTPYTSYEWRTSICIARRAQRLWPGDQRLEKIQFGIAVHEVLSHISDRVSANEACAAVVRDGFIPFTEALRLEQAVNAALHALIGTTPLLECISARGTLKEKSMLTESGSIRPDCVAVFADRIVVIDYKTGMPSTAHATQLREYCAVAAQLHALTIEAYLLYIGEGGVTTVEKLGKDNS